MTFRLSNYLIAGLFVVSLALIGCSGDSQRIVSPDTASGSSSSGLGYQDNTTLDDWFDYQYDDGSSGGTFSGGGTQSGNTGDQDTITEEYDDIEP